MKTFVAGVREMREEGYWLNGIFFFLCNSNKELIQWHRMMQSIPKLTLVCKSKGLSIGALKWQKIHQCQLWAPSNVPKTHWFLLNTAVWDQAFKHGRGSPTPTTPHRETEREKNQWLSCDHVTFGVTYYSYCKTSLLYQVTIYYNCLLILQNTCGTSYSQSKILPYFFPFGIQYCTF